MSERILVVEDEANIASFVSAYLEKAGYAVDRAVTGAEAKDKAVSCDPALILLDLNLPDMDGLEVCRAVRATSQVPILMLTARDDDVDKIVGLEVGADDYLTKPFNPRELVARIRSILRRATAPPPVSKGRRTHGVIAIDAGRRELTVDGRRSSWRPRSSTSSGSCSITAASCSRATSCSSGCGATRSRATRARSTCTCASSGARSARRARS